MDAAEIAYREAGAVIFEEVPRVNRQSRVDTDSQASTMYELPPPDREPEPRLSFNNPFGACPRCQDSETPSTTT